MNDIITIFPTSIMRKTFETSFTDEQINIFLSSEKRKGELNSNSLNTYILDLPEMKNIKEFCLQGMQDYLSEVMNVGDGVQIYITQSWLNWTETGEAHHKHSHTNSIISGVFYISTEQDDSINFIKKNEPSFFIYPKEWTQLNSHQCKIFAEEKNLLLFPSDLHHEVHVREGSKTRISLSFNSYIKGTIGNRISLNELVLE